MVPPLRIDAMAVRDVTAVVAMDGPSRMDVEQVRAELERPWSRMWVAREAGEEPVGYLFTWHVADELHVMNVATRPDRRRRGVARALLEAALRYAGERSVRQILLEVRRSNAAAIALYRGFGFFAMNLRLRYYPDDEDAVEMVLRLDDAGRAIAQADEVRLEG